MSGLVHIDGAIRLARFCAFVVASNVKMAGKTCMADRILNAIESVEKREGARKSNDLFLKNGTRIVSWRKAQRAVRSTSEQLDDPDEVVNTIVLDDLDDLVSFEED